MPDRDEKRTFEELIARYELEPDIRDIYVEGNSDKIIIEWFLEELTIEDIAVYDISTVEVPFERLVSLSLEDNNRGRVITLAFALHEGTDIDLTRVVACIADTDFDYILEKQYQCPILIFTEFTSIEVYLFNDEILGKFLDLVITNFPYEAATILTEMTAVLRDLFLIRLANQELGLGLEHLSFDRCCSIRGSRLQFDVGEYIYRYLNKGAQLHQRSIFEETIEKYRAKLSDDPRMHIHGHDFINLLLLYVSKVKRPKRAYDPDFFARSLVGVLEPRHVADTPLFAELVRRFG